MNQKETLRLVSHTDGWLSLHEGYFLYHAARLTHSIVPKKANSSIVEIGSWMGKSTICLASGSKSIGGPKVVAIDPHKGEFSKGEGIGKKSPTFKKFSLNLAKADVKDWVIPLVTTSEIAAKKWKKPISLLFIDGLHDYSNTHLDYSLWSHNVANNGIIAFHDAFCGYTGPEKVVLHEVFKKKWKAIGVIGSIIYVQKGNPKGIWQQANVVRNKLLIQIAFWLQRKKIPKMAKFLLIHRFLKLLLLNHYTFSVQFE